MEPRTAARAGLREGTLSIVPLLIGIVPFGMVFGVTAAQSTLGPLLGFASSSIVFAGAAQFAAVELANAGAAAAVIVLTVAIINSRHMMYSAALAPHFADFPRRWRYTLPYLMVDQAFAVAIVRYRDTDDPVFKRWFFLGAGGSLWSVWQASTALGIVLGAQIPSSWSLEFAVPLVFLALLVPALTDRPSVVAAAVAGVVVVFAQDVPFRLGLVVAALSGVAAGVIAGRLLEPKEGR